MTIKENILLKDYGTLRVGGHARFFCSVNDISELKESLQFAQDRNLPFIVLGAGSNMYFSDNGFPGLVIHMEILGMEPVKQNQSLTVRVGAGEPWDSFVDFSVSENLYGLENLSYIPGTVGASPVQNIGAYGTEVKNTIKEVQALDARTLETKCFKKEDCAFTYRDSFFKTKEGKNFIITHVIFELKKKDIPNISYADLRTFFKGREIDEISLRDVREAIIAIRKKKLPDPSLIGTLGSFFKNPIVQEAQYLNLKKEFPELVAYPQSENKYKISAAWIMDHACHLKGIRQGHMGTYESQPLALVNYGGATSSEVKMFSEKIKQQVKERTGITLHEEVNFIS